MIEKYLGTWLDSEGKKIIIKKLNEEVKTDFYDFHGKPGSRKYLGGVFKPTTDMKTYLDKKYLKVELGEEGLGAVLSLELIDEDVLVPTVEHGMYDDFDEFFGVSWLFPLYIYKNQ